MLVKSARRGAYSGSSINSSVGSGMVRQMLQKYQRQFAYTDQILSSQNRPRLTVMQKQLAGALMERAAQTDKMQSITSAAATNTANIMAKQAYSDMYPLLVANLILIDLASTFAMSAPKQLLPYWKLIAATTKGQTEAGKVLNSPFAMQSGTDPFYGSDQVDRERVLFEATGLARLFADRVIPTTVFITTPDGLIFRDLTGDGALRDNSGNVIGSIAYDTGILQIDSYTSADYDGTTATYRFDNQHVGRDSNINQDGGAGYLGTQISRTRGQLDTIEVEAKAYSLTSETSVFAQFILNQSYGMDLEEVNRIQNMGELAAEINAIGVLEMYQACLLEGAGAPLTFNAKNNPVVFHAGPNSVYDGFKVTLQTAKQMIRQKTQLATPNRLTVGSNGAIVVTSMSGDNFKADTSGGNKAGMHKIGVIGDVDVYDASMVLPPDAGFVSLKKDDNPLLASYIFGQFMPVMATSPVTLGNLSTQQGYATMCGTKVVNPATTLPIKFVI